MKIIYLLLLDRDTLACSLCLASLCYLCSGVSSALAFAQHSLSCSLRLANLCSLCSGISSALALARHSLSCSLRLANLCSLCSGVSSALALAQRSLSCSLCLANLYALCSDITSALALESYSLSCVLSAWSIVLSSCFGVIQNVITSHPFCGWCMCMMPCVHVPNAWLCEITIHITTVGLTQARPNYYTTYSCNWLWILCTILFFHS